MESSNGHREEELGIVPSAAPLRSTRRLRRIAITIACGALGVLGGLLTFVLLTTRRPPPVLTPDALDAAIARWEQHGPRDYDLDLEVRGGGGGKIHIEVRGGEPTAMTRNGIPAAEHTWMYWTIDGLFDIIRQDLEGLDQPERAFGVADPSEIVQQAEFDPKLGYPKRYRRAVPVAGREIEWEVTSFQAVLD